MRTLITNAFLADGENLSTEPKDVLIEGQTIAHIARAGTLGARLGEHHVNADGRMLAPGFIDTHAHADHSPLRTEDDTSKILQGVTTEVNGNCGFSMAPINELHSDDFNSLVERIFPPQECTWSDYPSYVSALEEGEFVTNFASLIGHNTIRVAAMGAEDRDPSKAEMATMERLVDEALEMGVAGLSTGLIYPRGYSAVRRRSPAWRNDCLRTPSTRATCAMRADTCLKVCARLLPSPSLRAPSATFRI